MKSPAKNLSPDAVNRILKATNLKITDEIRDKAHKDFNKAKLLENFFMWQNALVVDKTPSKTRNDIKKALKKCKELHDIFTGVNMDESQISDFTFAYVQARNKFGKNYVPGVYEIAEQFKRSEFVLREALAFSEGQIGKNSPHTQDFALNWLDHELSKMFKKIYKRKSAINSRPGDDKGVNSPFLRFVSQSMKEIAAAGYDINKRSYSHNAIRTRIKRT